MEIKSVNLIRSTKYSRNAWIFIILAILTLRMSFLFLAINDIPNTGASAAGFSWWYQHGGDETGYFDSAKALIKWEFLPKASQLGYSILLIPFVLIFGSESVQSIAVPAVIFNTVILGAIITIMVFVLSLKITEDKIKAWIVTTFYTIFPYLLYYFFEFFANDNPVIQGYKISKFKALMFFLILSDSLSVIFVLGSLLLMLKMIKDPCEKYSNGLFLGLLASFSMVVRLQNAIILVLYPFVFWLLKKIKSFKSFLVGCIPFVLFQAYSNYTSNKSIIRTAYGLMKGPNLDIPVFSLYYPLRIFIYPARYSIWLFPVMAAGAVVVILGLRKIYQKNKTLALFLLNYVFFNSFLILFIEPTLRNPRYFLPVIPVVFIFAVLGIEEIYFMTMQYIRNQKIISKIN
jgi:hypothetical protein